MSFSGELPMNCPSFGGELPIKCLVVVSCPWTIL